MSVWLISLFLALQAPTSTGKVEGIVVDSQSGKPVSGVLVSPPAFMPPSARPASNRATTDAEGRFLIQDLESGLLQIYARKDGYATNHEDVRVKPDEMVSGVTIRIDATGVLAGRVVDAKGEPAVGVRVLALQPQYERCCGDPTFLRRPVLSSTDNVETNDLGQFRLTDMYPGRYFVFVEPTNLPSSSANLSGSLFYPGTPDFSNATAVDVEPGKVLDLKDVVLTPSSAGWIRVHVNDPSRQLRTQSPLILMWGELGGDLALFQTRRSDPPAVRPLVAGKYEVCLDLDGRCEIVSYNGADMDVTIAVTKSTGQLSGRVLLDRGDGTIPSPLPGFSFNASKSGHPPYVKAQSGADGTFAASNYVDEGRYQFISFYGLPPGGYVASIRQGGRDALTEGFTAAGGDASIVVKADSGEVRGAVLNTADAKANHATVVLIPEESLRSRSDSQNVYRVGASDQNGAFEFTSVIPGDYRLYAFTDIQRGAHTDSDFMKPFEERGKPIHVGSSGKVTVDVQLAK